MDNTQKISLLLLAILILVVIVGYYYPKPISDAEYCKGNLDCKCIIDLPAMDRVYVPYYPKNELLGKEYQIRSYWVGYTSFGNFNGNAVTGIEFEYVKDASFYLIINNALKENLVFEVTRDVCLFDAGIGKGDNSKYFKRIR